MEITGRKEREYIILDESDCAGKKALVLKKIERQLVLYKYLASGILLEKKAIMGSSKENRNSLYNIPPSTIYKDMQDLTDAGLINLKYDSLNDWYENSNEEHDYDESKDSPNRRAHLKKLNRLAWCMRNLKNDPPEAEYDDDFYVVKVFEGEKSCVDYYRERFPDESQRTMCRDFETLTNIGYIVRYNKEIKRYDFFVDDILWEDYPRVPGIVYIKGHGLCHLTDEEYAMELQDNMYYETIGLKMGILGKEWDTFDAN